MSYLNLKKNKKKNSNILLNKIKSNVPLKIPHKNSYHIPQISYGGDISIEKSNPSPPIDTFELKIINELKNIKEANKDEKNSKLKKIYEDSIEYFIAKEYRNIFLLILKEFDDINKDYLNDIKYLKEKNEELNNKIKNKENENVILKKKLEENENEINIIKKKLVENIGYYNNHQNEINYEKNYNEEEEYEEENEYEENKNNSRYYDIVLNKNDKFNRNNYYFAQLNKKNIDDLDAIYFFDKINNGNINRKIIINNNGDNLSNNYNYINNKGEIVPELNLDPKYIEDCKKRELLKIEEAHLTPFQRVALQFEMS